MGFFIVDEPQRSEAWFLARLGRVTASEAKDMLSSVKSGEAAGRRNLRVRKVVERLTGKPQEEGYTSPAMERGQELEPDALAAYEARTGNLASAVGFLAHHDLMAGGSPDGVIGDFEGLVELKCPNSATHWGYLRGNLGCPPEHLAQLTHLLWLTGCQWIDFLSFDPRFPKDLQTFYCRVHRESVDIEGYAKTLKTFLDEVDREVAAAKGWSILAEEKVS